MADAVEQVRAHIDAEIRRLQGMIKDAEVRAEAYRASAQGAEVRARECWSSASDDVAEVEQLRRLVSIWTAAITRISVPSHQACDASADGKVPHDQVRRPGVPTPLACVFKTCPDPSRCGAECQVPSGSHAAHHLVLGCYR